MVAKINYRGVRPRGNSIHIDFRYEGVRCRETLPLKPTASNLKFAADLLGKIHLEILLGKLVYSDFFPNSDKVRIFGHKPISNITVSQALDWWFENNKPENEKSAYGMAININKHIKPGIGDIILRDLKANQVKKWIKSIKLSVSGRNSILTPLRSMFTEAHSEDLVEVNIMNKIH